jgi:ABC-2 type transport system ATP-binding protein
VRETASELQLFGGFHVAVLETVELEKRYGKIQALNGVSLNVKEGEIYGLLGQNGAGKTTLIKIVLGIIRGWNGSVSLLGKPAGTASVRSRVGYLPEDHRFPDYHTGYSLLDFYGQLLGMSSANRSQRIPQMLESVGIAERMHYKIRSFSKGMKQRLGIAQALMHDPQVIFLDEPTDGVDPVGRRDIRAMLLKLKSQGVTVFINSHLLGEVELICDRVAIMRKGKLIREGSVTSLTSQKGRFLIGLAPGQLFPIREGAEIGYEVAPLGERWEVQLLAEQTVDPILALLHTKNLNLRHLVEKRQTLEDLFLQTHSDRADRFDGADAPHGRADSEKVQVLKIAKEGR